MQKQTCFDPLINKSPVGAIVQGEEVTFWIDCSGMQPNEVLFMVKEDADFDYAYYPMKKVQNLYKISKKFDKFGHYWYNFKLIFNDYCLFISKTYDTRSYVSGEKGEDFLQLVTSEKYELDGALEGGLIYQILVDRFASKGKIKSREPLILRDDWGGGITKNTHDPLIINREVFGGNFKGVESKLGYLKDLGVTCIYFNPISMANSSHKYDTANYMTVDPMFGTDEDFESLVKEAKNLGIKVIIDGVYNHTGSDSVYFNKYQRFDSVGAYNSPESKYYPWYDFINYPDEYTTWWGIDTLPKIRYDATGFHDLIAGKGGVIEKFLNMGVFGVRLDVVDELNDNFTKMIAEKVKSFGKNRIVIGEVWEDAATKIAYSMRKQYFTQNELSSVMNYPIKETILSFIRNQNAFDLECTIRMLKNNYPKPVQDNLMNFLSTHDTNRIFSELLMISGGDRERAIRLLKIATAIMFTIIGVPSIFYGDEYGMENNDGSSRGCYDWNNNQNEVSDWFRKLSNLRKEPVFKHGDINILFCNDGKLVYERFDKTGHIIVAANTKDEPLKILTKGNFVSYLSGKQVKETLVEKEKIEILIEKK